MHYNTALVVFHFLVAQGKVKKGKTNHSFVLLLSSDLAVSIIFQTLSALQRSPEAM